jgi:hypothetical protein
LLGPIEPAYRVAGGRFRLADDQRTIMAAERA